MDACTQCHSVGLLIIYCISPCKHSRVAALQVARVLLEHGAEPNLQDRKEKTALHHAAMHESEVSGWNAPL